MNYLLAELVTDYGLFLLIVFVSQSFALEEFFLPLDYRIIYIYLIFDESLLVIVMAFHLGELITD